MSPGFKGCLWIALILGLWAGACRVKAGTLDELQQQLNGVHKAYPAPGTIGQCWFDKNGVLTFKKPEMKRNEICNVGFKAGDDGAMDFTVHYILTFRNDGHPTALYAFDEKTKKQTTLWRFGTSV